MKLHRKHKYNRKRNVGTYAAHLSLPTNLLVSIPIEGRVQGIQQHRHLIRPYDYLYYGFLKLTLNLKTNPIDEVTSAFMPHGNLHPPQDDEATSRWKSLLNDQRALPRVRMPATPALP